MADGVLAEMDELQKKEDQMVAKYQRQRELKLRKEEERKERMARRAKENMKQTLFKQWEEKGKRAVEEKVEFNKQAEMWKKDRDLWEEEDRRLKEKIQKINLDT